MKKREITDALPRCCIKCSRLAPEKCEEYKRCVRWCRWFHEEWTKIQRAAAPLIASKKAREEAMKAEAEAVTVPEEKPKPIMKRRSVCMPRTEGN